VVAEATFYKKSHRKMEGLKLNYTQSKLFYWQLVLQLFFIAMVPFMIQYPLLQGIFCLIGLVFLGIPHGGNDVFYRKEKTPMGTVRFLSMYLGVMLLYLLLWYYFPGLSLLIFLIISIHHFGQSNFNTHRILSFDSLLLGSWLVIFPILLHGKEVFGIFSNMLGQRFVVLDFIAHLGQLNLLVIALFFALVYGAVLYKLQRSSFFSYLLQWVLVSLWYWLTPLLLGFVVVFCFWHSLQSMQYQLTYIKTKYEQDWKKTLLGFAPLGLIAILGMGFLLRFDLKSNLSFAFVLLSLVTLPHVIVMDGIYRDRDSD